MTTGGRPRASAAPGTRGESGLLLLGYAPIALAHTHPFCVPDRSASALRAGVFIR